MNAIGNLSDRNEAGTARTHLPRVRARTQLIGTDVLPSLQFSHLFAGKPRPRSTLLHCPLPVGCLCHKSFRRPAPSSFIFLQLLLSRNNKARLRTSHPHPAQVPSLH